MGWIDCVKSSALFGELQTWKSQVVCFEDDVLLEDYIERHPCHPNAVHVMPRSSRIMCKRLRCEADQAPSEVPISSRAEDQQSS